MFGSHQHKNVSHPALFHAAKRKFARAPVWQTVVAGLAVGAMTLPALAQQLPAPTTRTGTVAATLTISFVTAPAAGSTVSCSLALLGNDTRSPSDGKFANASVSGSTAVCKIAVHYKWHLSSASSTMTIAYSVTGPTQSSSGIYDTIAMPANGATTTVAVAVTQ